jgi:hypothetical protein
VGGILLSVAYCYGSFVRAVPVHAAQQNEEIYNCQSAKVITRYIKFENSKLHKQTGALFRKYDGSKRRSSITVMDTHLVGT